MVQNHPLNPPNIPYSDLRFVVAVAVAVAVAVKI